MFGKPWILLTCAMLALFLCAGPGASAQEDRGIGGVASGVSGGGKRVALVIGNGAYMTANPLPNPPKDAKAIATMLKTCGFDVLPYADLDLEGMDKAVKAFAEKIPGADCALFFFAGHGLQKDGLNYLVPVKREPETQGEIRSRCLDAQEVLAAMEASGARVSILILDACRNNPLPAEARAGMRGLASMNAPKGSLIAFATSPGKEASDGPGANNSPFTASLLRQLPTPGVDVEQILKRVTDEVLQQTKETQSPWRQSNLRGDFYFVPGTAPEATTAASTPVVAPPAPVAPSLVGHLQVAVNAPEAKVIIDGKAAGKAKLNEALNISNLPVGKTPVRVEAEGYEPLEKVVDIPENDWAQEKFVLAKVIVVMPEDKRPPTVITPGPPSGSGASDGSKTKTVDLGGEVSMEMVWIPPGTFTMGSPSSEESRDDDEAQHEVTISRGFWLGKYEVTQGQWEAVMGNNPSNFKGDKNLPVEEVSWDDCQSFIQKLNGRSGAGFRLPTEAEWEYACRAGTRTPFSFGETISTDQANYNGRYTYGNGRKGTARGKPTPVGSFPANAWGLYDMHGNVWEWCSDWYDRGYYANSPGNDPAGPLSGSDRVDRGGSWFSDPGYCRSAGRNYSPDDRGDGLGFRLAVPVVQ